MSFEYIWREKLQHDYVVYNQTHCSCLLESEYTAALLNYSTFIFSKTDSSFINQNNNSPMV